MSVTLTTCVCVCVAASHTDTGMYKSNTGVRQAGSGSLTRKGALVNTKVYSRRNGTLYPLQD